MSTIAETFTRAVQLHQAGDWLRAEQLYREVSQADPSHGDAHQMLGILTYQLGRYEEAATFFRDALHHGDSTADYHNNLGLALHALGRLEEAVSNYQEALNLQPDMAEAHNNLGNSLVQQRRLDEAAIHYRRALQLQPNYAQAHCGLGLALAEKGELNQAATHYRQALLLQPQSAEVHNNLANVLLRQGRTADSVTHCQLALRCQPEFAEAHFNLGNALIAQKNWVDAEACLREALRIRPTYAESFNALGCVLDKLGRDNEAFASYENAVRFNEENAEAHNNLGNSLVRRNKLEEAVDCYQHALRLDPLLVAAWNNLGRVCANQGKLDEAIRAFEQTLRISPTNAKAHANLGDALRRLGKLETAVASCAEAIRLEPNNVAAHISLAYALQASGKKSEAQAHLKDVLREEPESAEVHNALGTLLTENWELDRALFHFEQAVSMKPDFAEAHSKLASLLAELGRMSDAVPYFQESHRLSPNDMVRVKEATALPALCQSMSDMKACREQLAKKVDRLLNEGVKVDLTNEIAAPVFFLSYQGLNDRDLQRKIAGLYAAPEEFSRRPSFDEERSKGKIKLGLVSNCFRSHSVGHWMRGFVEHLSRDNINLTVLSAGSYDDVIARLIQEHADRYIELPTQLTSARRLISDQQFDILFYPDIGLDPYTYTLAFSRLAKIQCTTVGHPATSGLDTIDYYISSMDLETEAAAEQFTEALIRFENLPIYIYRQQRRPGIKRRQDFGLKQDDHVYGCLQYLFKFHPEFDDILGGILRSDPKGILLLSQGRVPAWERLLRQRFATTLADVSDRIRILPHMDYPSYLDLLAAIDVQLDTIHFGGGMTSYEALAGGLPIVTLPSKFTRGRFTYALYKQMQIMDCVARDARQYIDIAVQLGTDKPFREFVRNRILAANDILFENSAGIREWESFLYQTAMNSTS